MSQNQGRSGQGRRRRGKKPKASDLWRPVPPLPDPEPIVAASDPTVVVRSLGTPPLKGQGSLAEANLAVVVDAASQMAASALAALAGLMPPPDPDEDAL